MRLNSMKDILTWVTVALIAWGMWIIPFILCLFNGISYITTHLAPLLNLI